MEPPPERVPHREPGKSGLLLQAGRPFDSRGYCRQTPGWKRGVPDGACARGARGSTGPKETGKQADCGPAGSHWHRSGWGCRAGSGRCGAARETIRRSSGNFLTPRWAGKRRTNSRVKRGGSAATSKPPSCGRRSPPTILTVLGQVVSDCERPRQVLATISHFSGHYWPHPATGSRRHPLATNS